MLSGIWEEVGDRDLARMRSFAGRSGHSVYEGVRRRDRDNFFNGGGRRRDQRGKTLGV
jgi:hypothetical protein